MTHTDQLTFMMKYVSPNGRIHKGFLKLLLEMGMDINIYRGWCYNNGGLEPGSEKLHPTGFALHRRQTQSSQEFLILSFFFKFFF